MQFLFGAAWYCNSSWVPSLGVGDFGCVRLQSIFGCRHFALSVLVFFGCCGAYRIPQHFWCRCFTSLGCWKLITLWVRALLPYFGCVDIFSHFGCAALNQLLGATVFPTRVGKFPIPSRPGISETSGVPVAGVSSPYPRCSSHAAGSAHARWAGDPRGSAARNAR